MVPTSPRRCSAASVVKNVKAELAAPGTPSSDAEPGHDEALEAGERDQVDRVADSHACLVGCLRAEHDLVVGGGRSTVGELERRELGVVDPVQPDALGHVQRLAVDSDDLGVADPVGDGGIDAVDGTDPVDVVEIDRTAQREDLVFAHGQAADDDVDAVVHVGDRVIERLDHGVGEDHRPRGECDAEDDGERGGEQAQLLGEQVADGHAEHGVDLRF